MVSGRLDLTVVDLAIPGTRGTKKLGLRDGLNLEDEADSVWMIGISRMKMFCYKNRHTTTQFQ